MLSIFGYVEKSTLTIVVFPLNKIFKIAIKITRE